MKIFVVITVARQILGDLVFVRTEKGFTQASKADSYMKELKASYTKDGKIIPVKVSTPQGEANCFCEVGAFDIDVEDLAE